MSGSFKFLAQHPEPEIFGVNYGRKVIADA
jgi:hypothetical protein